MKIEPFAELHLAQLQAARMMRSRPPSPSDSIARPEEVRDWPDRIEDGVVRYAAVIACARRARHYEIAVCGTRDCRARQEGLDEKKAADEKLSVLARHSVNAEAAA